MPSSSSRRNAAEPQSWERAADPALAYAQQQMAYYRRGIDRARRMHQTGELLILLITAATVVVSALRAPAQLTASFAAVTLFLTGYRQVFNPNDRWVSSTEAWLSLQQSVARYHLLPEAERDEAARRALLERTIEVMTAESQHWAAHRRAAQPGPAVVPVQGPGPGGPSSSSPSV